METINLYRMRRMIRETEKLSWKLEREESKATSAAASWSGVRWSRSGHSRTEDGAIRICEVKDAYREVLDALREMRKALDPMIDDLENPDDRAVMRLRYLQGYRPERIAEAVYMTDRMIYYILSRSEKELARKHPEKVTEGK